MYAKHLWLLGAFCGILCCSSAQANDAWKTRTFDVVYDTANGLGQGTLRIASDGRGRGLMEIAMGRVHRKYISDSKSQTTYLIIGEQGCQKVVQMAYDDEKLRSMSFDENQRKESAALGAKVVAGHRCHGYRNKTSYGGVADTWIGDDTGFTVGRSSNHPLFGVSTAVLRSFSAKPPATSSFQLPAGVKVVADDGSYQLFGAAGAKQY